MITVFYKTTLSLGGELMTEICSARSDTRTKTGKCIWWARTGHPDLLTIRAAELLKTAEVIVYDRLIQDES